MDRNLLMRALARTTLLAALAIIHWDVRAQDAADPAGQATLAPAVKPATPPAMVKGPDGTLIQVTEPVPVADPLPTVLAPMGAFSMTEQPSVVRELQPRTKTTIHVVDPEDAIAVPDPDQP